MKVVRITDLATSKELTTDERIHALAMSIEWLGIAQAMIVIHGKQRAADRLEGLGCPIRFDDEGEPVVVLA